MASNPQRSGIKETDVWTAADALLLEGARPTIERIRQKVGRGSPNTVGPYLDTWFKGLGARIRDPGAFAARTGVPDPVAQAATHFWEAALALARSEATAALDHERDALSVEHESLAAARAALATEAERLATRAAAQDEAMRLAQTQLSELRAQRDEFQEQLHERVRLYATLEDRMRELTSEYEATRAQHEAERAKFDERVRTTEERAASHEHRWLQEVDRAREALRVAEARALRSEHEARAQVERVAGQLEQAQALAHRHEARLAALEPECERLQREVARHPDVLADLRNTAEGREASLTEQIVGLRQQIAQLVQQLADKDHEHAALLRQLVKDAQRSHTTKSRRRPVRV
jgi:chromosome segregation ATPase